MHYNVLQEGIKYFQGKWPPNRGIPGEKYAALRKRGDNYWLHLEALGAAQLIRDIIDGFLNTKTWNCHIPADELNYPVLRDSLKAAVDNLSEYYTSVQGYKIEDVNFQGHVSLKGKQESIQDVINSIYSTFLQMKAQFGRVAASKLMHMALPDLFVMWDSSIIQKYCIPTEPLPGLERKASSYVAFLVLMQENISHVIESYPQASELKKPDIVQCLLKAHDNRSLPRQLDMANMAVRDCEQAICIRCRKKAKVRWHELGIVTTDDSTDEYSSV